MSGHEWRELEALATAAKSCARRKGARADAIAFRMREGEELLALAARLASERYRPEPGLVFVTEKPKFREIHAAAYRDRVVHHLLHRVLESRFERSFIKDSYACRPGKGTHAAAKALQQHLRQATRQGGRRAYALQMDIQNFFGSLHKPTLLELIRRRLSLDERRPAAAHTPWSLVQVTVRHDATQGARRRGNPALFARVPAHKRLGAQGPHAGLPIGNLTSQFFANVYLDALDQFVKRTLGARHYVRYADDFVLVHPDPEVLRQWEARIRAFLHARLRLSAHPVKTLLPASGGVDFVGYIVRPDYLLPRRRVVQSLRKRLDEKERQAAAVEIAQGMAQRLTGLGWLRGPCMAHPMDSAQIERLRATWASYEGHLRLASAHRLRRRLWSAHRFSRAVLVRSGSGKLTRRFRLPRPVPSFRAQVRQLEQGVGAAVLIVQVGRSAECPRLWDMHRLGLRGRWRRGRFSARVPWPSAAWLVDRALAKGLSVVVVLETDGAAGAARARQVRWFIRPRLPGFS